MLAQSGLVRKASKVAYGVKEEDPPLKVERKTELKMLEKERRVSRIDNGERASLSAVLSPKAPAHGVIANPAAMARARAAKEESIRLSAGSEADHIDESETSADLCPDVKREVDPSDEIPNLVEGILTPLSGVRIQPVNGQSENEEDNAAKDTIMQLQAALQAAEERALGAESKVQHLESQLQNANERVQNVVLRAEEAECLAKTMATRLYNTVSASDEMRSRAEEAEEMLRRMESQLREMESRFNTLQCQAASGNAVAGTLKAENKCLKHTSAEAEHKLRIVRSMLAQGKMTILANRWRAATQRTFAASTSAEQIAESTIAQVLEERHQLLRIKLGLPI